MWSNNIDQRSKGWSCPGVAAPAGSCCIKPATAHWWLEQLFRNHAHVSRSDLELGELRNRIVRMLFKQLTAANEALVELAHQALGVIINHTRMPKVLLPSPAWPAPAAYPLA